MRNHRNGFTKIGMTRNKPVFREETLCSQEPEITTMFYFSGVEQDEKDLHLEFASVRKRGEWFDLSEQDIDHIKNGLGNKVINPDW